ncbi:MAG: hypothetical protein ACAI43_03235 [Phycisphaerae bacterium]
MVTDPLAKHYAHLSPRERLRALLEAHLRDDDATATRLWDTCPTHSYRSTDSAFRAPHDQLARLTLAVAVEVGTRLGALGLLDRLGDRVLPPYLILAVCEAVGRAEDEAAPGGGPDGVADADPDAESEVRRALDATLAGDTEPARQLAEQFLPETAGAVADMVAGVRLRELAKIKSVLAGLDGVTGPALGMSAADVLRAFVPHVGRAVAALDLAGVPTDPQLTEEYAGVCRARWQKATASD